MSLSGRASGGSELHKDGEVPETGKGGCLFSLSLKSQTLQCNSLPKHFPVVP